MKLVRIMLCMGMIVTSVEAYPGGGQTPSQEHAAMPQDPFMEIVNKFLAGNLLEQQDIAMLCQACPELARIIPLINFRMSPLRALILATVAQRSAQSQVVQQSHAEDQAPANNDEPK